jgi:hypothetical protein
MKDVFDTKAESGYDDDITWRYHFLRQHRTVADALTGSWIVYREPKRNARRRAYVAVARVSRIERAAARSRVRLHAGLSSIRRSRPVRGWRTVRRNAVAGDRRFVADWRVSSG